MIEVAVIGAGSAGLVTARHLLANGLKCCVFEATSTLGGAWSASSSLPSKKMWEGLHTNLSKHTCRFSDFPWPEDTPIFPSKEDMDQYLTSYANEFLFHDDPSNCCSFLYNCKVTRISPEDSQYRVEWMDSVHQTHSKEFGGVVVATGFFSKPKYPYGFLPEHLHQEQHIHENVANEQTLHIIHAKDYSSHQDFANSCEDEGGNVSIKDEKVVVVGSSHSALEIAVDASKSVENPITVVLSRVPWVVPRYVPDMTAKQPTFLPIDLAFYRRKGNKKEESTVLTPDLCFQKHQDLNNLLGSRQDKILPVPKESWEEPPFVAVSDYFLDLVADGRIQVVHGRLEKVDKDKRDLTITTSNAKETTAVLSDVTSLICCTGYLPDLESCFGALENDEQSFILETIDYDKTDSFSPMTTYLETLHPDLQNLAFVGMYRGSYMGVVELQARLAAGALSGSLSIPAEEFDKGLKVSQAIRNPLLKPQFPRYDYPGFMESLAGAVFSGSSLAKLEGDMVTPAMYQPNPDLAEDARFELDREIQAGRSGQHLPRVVQSALVGSWSFERNILHFSGRSIAQRQYIHGKVKYSRSKDLGHVLYREDGLFELSESKSLPVFREYEYQVTDDGALELYFVEGGKRTYIFLSLKFQHQDEDGYWVATNDHLCIKDLYTANFRIKLDGLTAREAIITYRVKGPAKDYESTTIMRPI